MNNENKDLLNNDVEINVSEDEIILAPPVELFDEAKEIAQSTRSDENFPFALQYDSNQKEFLLSMLETVGAIVENDDDDGHVLDTVMNMTQLAFIKQLDCVERVKTDEGINPFLAEEAVKFTPIQQEDEDLEDEVQVAVTDIDPETLEVQTEIALNTEPEQASSDIAIASVSATARSSNVSMETAATISDESYTSGYICCPGAEQWFKFVAKRTGRYTICTTGSLDTIGTLYDCWGNLITEVDDYAPCGKLNFRIICNLTEGNTYYVKVGISKENVGSYMLRVTERVYANYVNINKSTITLEKGVTYELPITPNYTYKGYNGAQRIPGLSVSISPSNANEQKIWWREQYGSVLNCSYGWDDDGDRYIHVTATGIGAAKLYAVDWNENGKRDECTVCVGVDPAPINGLYNIVNVETGKVANISGSYLVNLSDGKNITLYSKSGSNEQVWKIDKISDSEDCYIRSYVDQEYGFNAYRSSSGNYNCNIHKITGNETDAAVYFVLQDDGSYKIKLANYSNYYLTAIASNNGSDIRWQSEDSEKNQHWKLEVADFTEREVIATEVISNIQNCSTNLIPSNRKTASVAVAQAMLNIGYPVSFVAGMLANIVFEGSTGQFESSNYVSHPENKPDYLVYMDTEYNGTNYYLNNFSGKTIMDVGVDSTYNMLCELAEQSNNTWYIDGRRVGFGLGCIQWSFARTLNLVNAYREINNNSNSITTEQACQGESLLMLRELGSPEYNSIISSWRAANASLNSSSAASSAGSYLCNNYIRPKDDTGSVASTRATRAAAIYSAIAI